MKIILMRHGKPDFDFSRRVNAAEFARIALEYDTAGIVDQPPTQAMELAVQGISTAISQ